MPFRMHTVLLLTKSSTSHDQCLPDSYPECDRGHTDTLTHAFYPALYCIGFFPNACTGSDLVNRPDRAPRWEHWTAVEPYLLREEDEREREREKPSSGRGQQLEAWISIRVGK